MVRGTAWYRLEGTPIKLESPRYLLLNHGQPYQIEIDDSEPVQSFCVFFGAGFVEDAARALKPGAMLLDEPFDLTHPFTVIDRLYPFDERVIPCLLRLKQSIGAQAGDTEDRLRDLAESLVTSQDELVEQADSLGSRPSTRAELSRRLYRACDYMESHLDRRINLGEISRAACLSPHHFHRSFRSQFRQTPHQYLTRLRLDRARLLLTSTRAPIQDVCIAVGMESLPSFTALFRREYGVSPGQFRKIR